VSDDPWDTLRKDVARRLPDLIDKALAAYAHFAGTLPPDDAKAFAAHQASCRAALAHVHLLVKLAEWARSGDGLTGDGAADLARLIEAAELAMDRYDED
jgi:hypothetical protein